MFKSGIFVMIITMISRLLGLLRIRVIASLFSYGPLTDAFFASFKIANLFRQLLGEGALGTVFIPIYNDTVEKQGKEKAKSLIFSILNILMLFLLLIYGFTFIFSNQILSVIVSGFDPATQQVANKLLKLMAVYIVFIGLSGMICAILNNFKQFVVPASTSILFNLATIICAYVFNNRFGIFSLALGVVIGGLLQLLIVIPSFFKIVKSYEFKMNFKDPAIRKVFILMVPMLLGIFARQLNTIIDQYFASFLNAGGITALEYATRVYSLPIGVFGISIATIIYPELSRRISKNDNENVVKSINNGLKFLAILVVPTSFIFILFPQEVIKLILGTGKFSDIAIMTTGESLLYYSIGLFAYTGVHIMSRAFYGMKNTKSPVIFSITSIIINIVLNAILVKYMAHKGLALATAIASISNFLLLYIFFNIKYLKLDKIDIILFLIKTSVASLVAYFIANLVGNFILVLLIFGVIYSIIIFLLDYKFIKSLIGAKSWVLHRS